jgi:hypothetical protein
MRKHVLQKQAAHAHASTAAGAQAASGCSRERSPAADAAGERAQVDGGGGGGSSSAVKFSVLPGEVVWVQTKGNAPWPALVITAEEAVDFSVDVRQQRVAQVRIINDVCIHRDALVHTQHKVGPVMAPMLWNMCLTAPPVPLMFPVKVPV